MAFNENEFQAELAHNGYKTNESFLKAYNERYDRMSPASFYNKLAGRSDWKRKEISNVAELLNSQWSSIQKIFFYKVDTV